MLGKQSPTLDRFATASPVQNGLTLAAITLSFLVPFLLYFDTARSIVAIWNSSETFAHGYIILPISLWLVWRRRENFAILLPRPFAPALALLALVGFSWLLARMGEVQVVMQYALVTMIPVIAIAMLGYRLAWSLAFPLLFILLAVPFGEVFIDPLISFTADFTVRALQATGIPVLRNGTRFEIPSGSWSVVEACSGVRYLISSITLGTLYAYLTYRSAARRAAFMVIAVLMPIIANGMRAYMIVMIGHLSDMKLAVGFDHLIYGWVFFGAVIFIMFWIGSYWREELEMAPVATTSSASAKGFLITNAINPTQIAVMALAVVAVTAVWPLFAVFNDRATVNSAPVQIRKIDIEWPQAASTLGWTPRYAKADGEFTGVYQAPADVSTAPVTLSVLYYRNQRNGKALISSTNRLVGKNDNLHQVGGSTRTESIGSRTLVLRESELQGTGTNLLVWSWFWIDGRYISNNYGGKLIQAWAKLMFRGDDGAALFLAAPYGLDAEPTRKSMRAFLSMNMPAIDAALVNTRSH